VEIDKWGEKKEGNVKCTFRESGSLGGQTHAEKKRKPEAGVENQLIKAGRGEKKLRRS